MKQEKEITAAANDGSGDIVFIRVELAQIVKVLQEVIANAEPEDLVAISVLVMRQGVVVNIRPPRLRGPVESKDFMTRPYGTSSL